MSPVVSLRSTTGERARLTPCRVAYTEEIAMTEINTPNPRPSLANSAWLAFCWLWVGVPLAWGVFETVQRSLALFR